MTTELDPKQLSDVLDHSTEDDGLSLEEKQELKSFFTAPAATDLPQQLTAEQESALAQEGSEPVDIRAQISSMGLPGKIKLALFGNSICRGLLVRDSNKLVQQFVMKNPKLQVREVEEFARNPHISDQVLRLIADSKMWMKSALVKYNLVTNPKTPQDVALKWLRYLQAHEVRRIAKSKNIPQIVTATAKKLVNDAQ